MCICDCGIGNQITFPSPPRRKQRLIEDLVIYLKSEFRISKLSHSFGAATVPNIQKIARRQKTKVECNVHKHTHIYFVCKVHQASTQLSTKCVMFRPETPQDTVGAHSLNIVAGKPKAPKVSVRIEIMPVKNLRCSFSYLNNNHLISRHVILHVVFDLIHVL